MSNLRPTPRPSPRDPDDCPWTDVLYRRSQEPDQCYYTESRWCVRCDPEADEPAGSEPTTAERSEPAHPGEAA